MLLAEVHVNALYLYIITAERILRVELNKNILTVDILENGLDMGIWRVEISGLSPGKEKKQKEK